MLHYVQDVRVVRGMGQGLLDHHVVLCKVKLVGTWIKRREVVVEARIRSEKLREHQYRERYDMSFEGKGVEWDGDKVKQMWEQVKLAMVESAREVYNSMKVREKNPKSVLWNNEVKAAVRRKEAPWKELLATSNEEVKGRCMEAYREEKV